MRFFRKPDENSGPAIADREPVVLPDERKKAAEKVKELVGNGDNKKQKDRENPEEYKV